MDFYPMAETFTIRAESFTPRAETFTLWKFFYLKIKDLEP